MTGPDLFHGGASGLAVGDRIEGGRGRGPGRAYDIAPHEHDRVYVTPDVGYAEKFAHQYPRGDVYRVRALGPLTRSWADGPESYTCPAAEVVGVHRRAVELHPLELAKIDASITRAFIQHAPQTYAWVTADAGEPAEKGASYFHGGAPGLRAGDWIEPGHPRGPKRRGLIEILGSDVANVLDPPTLHSDRVYLTRSRLYASLYAHTWPKGDLYEVEPLGPVLPAWEDGPETVTAARARIRAVVRRGVTLPKHKLERAARANERAWQRNDDEWLLASLQMDALGPEDLDAFTSGPLYAASSGRWAGRRSGDLRLPLHGSKAVMLTDSREMAEGWSDDGRAVPVEAVGDVWAVRRDGAVIGSAPSLRLTGGDE